MPRRSACRLGTLPARARHPGPSAVVWLGVFTRHPAVARHLEAAHVEHAGRRIGRGAAPVRAAPRARELDVIPLVARRREHAVVGGVANGLRRRSCSSALMNGLTSSGLNTWRANGGGFVGNGCVGDDASPGTSLLRHGSFFDWPERLPGQSLEHVEKSGLARLGDDVDRLVRRGAR